MATSPPRLLRTSAGFLALAAVFLALNFRALDSYFQDDEFDNMAWTTVNAPAEYVRGFVTPLFDTSNFRPTGHLYFRWMTQLAGPNFAAWAPSLWAIHLFNAGLLFLLLRRLGVSAWHGVVFFTLSVAAMDVYWKPMYVFDLLCATFCLASLLFYTHRRWVLSFLAFWLAYKAKEPAVLLPLVLALYEYWYGERRWLRLGPFFAVSLSFGLQGLLLNPNKDNDYTFRFSLAALQRTVPFYLGRVLWLPLLLIPLRDRLVNFGLAGFTVVLSLLLFLPGRLFEAYTYLPMVFLAIALAAAAQRAPRLIATLGMLWLIGNGVLLRREQRALLARSDEHAAFAEPIRQFALRHPDIRALVFDGRPSDFHDWGIAGVWNYGHGKLNLPALHIGNPEAAALRRAGATAFALWREGQMSVTIAGAAAESKGPPPAAQSPGQTSPAPVHR